MSYFCKTLYTNQKVFIRMLSRLKCGFILFLGVAFVFFIVFIVSIISGGVSDDLDLLSWIYYLFSALGHAALISLILFIVLYLPLTLIFKKNKIGAICYMIGAVIVQFLLILDSYVFDLYKFHINGFVLELVFGGGASDIFVFDSGLYLRFGIIILFSAILPFILIYYIASKNYKKIGSRSIALISVFLIISLLISHIGHAVARATNQASIQKSATVLPLFFPLTANSLLKKLGIVDVKDVDFRAYNKVSSDIQYPLNPIELTRDSLPRYNIVYILIDSWNFTTFDSIVSPNIYKFAHKGQVFTNHNSSNNGTRGSVFGFFFGLSFTYENEFNISKMSPLIIDRTLDMGYDIETFPSATFISPPFYEIVYRRVPGISVNTEGTTPFERDTKITNNYLSYLNQRTDDKPIFSFLFYDLPHAMSLPTNYKKEFESPWNSPDYLALNNKMDRTPFFNLYKSCVYRTDELIGEVLEKMESDGMLENTIVVITGDHGQEFNENKKNYWGHGSNYSKWQLQVPFIIYYPGIEGGKINHHMTTHYDVSPTILHRFLGVKNPSGDYSMGYDLWDESSRYPHVVGDHVNYAFVMPDMILKTGHIGTLDITDRNMNSISRDSINVSELQQAIKQKNKFYK